MSPQNVPPPLYSCQAFALSIENLLEVTLDNFAADGLGPQWLDALQTLLRHTRETRAELDNIITVIRLGGLPPTHQDN